MPRGSRVDTTLAVAVPSLEDQERRDLVDDAEDSLEDLELKRKAESQAGQVGVMEQAWSMKWRMVGMSN